MPPREPRKFHIPLHATVSHVVTLGGVHEGWRLYDYGFWVGSALVLFAAATDICRENVWGAAPYCGPLGGMPAVVTNLAYLFGGVLIAARLAWLGKWRRRFRRKF